MRWCWSRRSPGALIRRSQDGCACGTCTSMPATRVEHCRAFLAADPASPLRRALHWAMRCVAKKAAAEEAETLFTALRSGQSPPAGRHLPPCPLACLLLEQGPAPRQQTSCCARRKCCTRGRVGGNALQPRVPRHLCVSTSCTPHEIKLRALPIHPRSTGHIRSVQRSIFRAVCLGAVQIDCHQRRLALLLPAYLSSTLPADPPARRLPTFDARLGLLQALRSLLSNSDMAGWDTACPPHIFRLRPFPLLPHLMDGIPAARSCCSTPISSC